MRTIRRLFVLSALGFAVSVVPVHAQGNGSHAKSPVNWQQRDTAIYVASTLNLLSHTKNHTVQQVFQRLNITHIDVYADNDQSNLYFIELKRDDSSTAGTLAYQLGWPGPKRISWSAGKTLPTVSAQIAQAYKSDSKTLIGTFTSPLP
jgi:hypothetical protein